MGVEKGIVRKTNGAIEGKRQVERTADLMRRGYVQQRERENVRSEECGSVGVCNDGRRAEGGSGACPWIPALRLSFSDISAVC